MLASSLQVLARQTRGGWSYNRAALMGMPDIHSFQCPICGRPTQNAHHIVPKGMGGGSKKLVLNGIELLSPTIDVCGLGNASGCHGDFHAGRFSVRWVWDVGGSEEAWFSGELMRDAANTRKLWALGHYDIYDTATGKTITISGDDA